jgi:glycosyltransferase involved in cell wall biosynthesis
MSVKTAAVPRVTVVMAVHNAAQFLHDAVASVLVQTYCDFELIVVDDSSSDDSLSILQGFDDPRIRIIRHKTNMGAALSRNDALVAARGELVAIMDADDLCAPTRLERQVAFLDANPLVGLLGCSVYDNIDASGEVLYTSYLPEDNETIQRTLVERWCFLHPSIMFRKVIQEHVGGYRKAFEVAEDHDFILRMLDNCQAHNLSERLVSYRLNPKGLSVLGHRYINELGDVAMRVAQRRRSGRAEDLDAEMSCLFDRNRRRKVLRGFAGAIQTWRDSLYAANRYYGFGCRELCADNLEQARRCFVRSLRTNCMFVKSWIGAAISLMPFAAGRLKFLFRTSMRQSNDLSRLRALGNGNVGRPIVAVHRTSTH